MLYHYYMKINLKLLLSILIFVCFFHSAWAQVVIVKQDGQKVFLDTSEFNRQVSVGDSFKIITSQEKLINPKTGKNLGLINHYSAEGKITEVQPLYAIGQMPDKTVYSIGQEAVFFSTPKNTSTSVSSVPSKPQPKPVISSERKIKEYPVLEQEIISAVKTDLTSFPDEEIVTLDTKGQLTLYQDEQGILQKINQYQIPSGKKPITLSAKDLMDAPYAQIFATVYDENKQKISTLIFKIQDNAFQLIDTVPYFVKEIGCDDEKEIFAQKPFINGAKPSDARELEYEKGNFRLDNDRISTRGNWLTGTNYYEIQNNHTANFIYTASNGKIRLRLLDGKYAESNNLFATAPNRVKYKQELISFYPSLQAYGPDGKATLVAVENTAKLGLLSEQFGQYNGSKIHFLMYENGKLNIKETLSLSGFVYDTNCSKRGIFLPQVLSSGQTVLTEIYR